MSEASTPTPHPAHETPPISEQQVRQVAQLSRLQLTPAQVQDYTRQLAEILGYVRKLDELDLADVEPLYHPGDQHSVTREDQVGPTLSPEQAMQNAPSRSGPFFRVPRVLGDGGGA